MMETLELCYLEVPKLNMTDKQINECFIQEKILGEVDFDSRRTHPDESSRNIRVFPKTP